MPRFYAVAIALIAISATPTSAAIIPGTSNPWLAGMPNGSTAGGNDSAPGQSPVLLTGVPIVPGTYLTFSVTGSVSNTPGPSGLGPDGGAMISAIYAPENGMSNVTAPINSLIGVFLDNSQPNLYAPPANLDFTGNLDFATLSPALRQPFFIGDGLTSGAIPQQFVVPAGATRLYLGTMDGYEWNNNSGAFDVTTNASSAAVPEPATLAVFGVLALGAVGIRRRKPA